MSFEIATFEHSVPYDGTDTVEPENIVNEFMGQYKKHLKYYPEEEVKFSRGRLWLAYTDNTGGDKPMRVMLIGPITDELIAQIKEAVRVSYVKRCEDCDKEMSKERSCKSAVCEPCANA
jgi:hypothetical protein